jgi:hypothetical protein
MKKQHKTSRTNATLPEKFFPAPLEKMGKNIRALELPFLVTYVGVFLLSQLRILNPDIAIITVHVALMLFYLVFFCVLTSCPNVSLLKYGLFGGFGIALGFFSLLQYWSKDPGHLYLSGVVFLILGILLVIAILKNNKSGTDARRFFWSAIQIRIAPMLCLQSGFLIAGI